MSTDSGILSRRLTLSGLWVAAIGFFTTRFTVTLAAYEQPTQFFLAGVVPLILGLLLAIFGVALVVGAFDPTYVRTVALWCTVGMLSMFVLVVLTLLGSNPSGLGSIGSVTSKVYLSNFLIGGSILGTLIGLYAAENSQHQLELRQQANRLVTLNRILRHEVLNAITVIRGSTEVIQSSGDTDEPIGHIEQKSDHVVDTIEDVKYLTQTERSEQGGIYPSDLARTVDDTIETIEERYPGASVNYSRSGNDGVQVWADSRLSHVLYHLVENAIVHNDDSNPSVDIELAVGRDVACVRITDSGPGLPEDQRRILEEGAIPDHDDPRTGFGTNLARMFVERYGGDISTDQRAGGTMIEVELRRVTESAPPTQTPTDVRSYGLEPSQLVTAVGAALVAGGAMGVVIQAMAGVVPIIGALYGVPDPFIGWITHEFHSVVFGLVFAGLILVAPQRYSSSVFGYLGVGLAWSTFLWLFAAGVVMPVWQNLIGIPAPIPHLTPPALVGHLIWGSTLGVVYHYGGALSVLPGKWGTTAY